MTELEPMPPLPYADLGTFALGLVSLLVAAFRWLKAR